MSENKNKAFAWSYCYMRGEKVVFLNRWDEDIRVFNDYDEAVLFAEQNYELINKRIEISSKKEDVHLECNHH